MPNDDIESRVTRIEDRQGFAEHDADQLSGQVIEVFEKLDHVLARLDQLERRLQAVETPTETHDPLDERPPHAAG